MDDRTLELYLFFFQRTMIGGNQLSALAMASAMVLIRQRTAVLKKGGEVFLAFPLVGD